MIQSTETPVLSDDVKIVDDAAFASTSPAVISSDTADSKLSLVRKKTRSDFYKALQALDFHTVQMSRVLSEGRTLPDKEAFVVQAYIENLIRRLGVVNQQIT